MIEPAHSHDRFRCTACGGEIFWQRGAAVLSCLSCSAAFAADDGIVALTPPSSDPSAVASAKADRDYPEDLVDLVAAVESRHFWFTARNDVILSTLRQVMGSLAGRRALDVGCGTGFVMAALERAGLAATGIDMHRRSLMHARARTRGPLFASTATTLPFFSDFDMVALFDVIEHVDDDVGVLAEARSVLVPGGHVVVTVPAGPGLWSEYDEVIGHKRRYTRDALAAALRNARLEVCRVSYFNAALFLAGLIRRSSGGQKGVQDDLAIVRRALQVPPRPINTLFRWSVKGEAPLRSVPWFRGGSLIAIAQRARQ